MHILNSFSYYFFRNIIYITHLFCGHFLLFLLHMACKIKQTDSMNGGVRLAQ
nr:MAG TPA: hypothetical protein [Caudoviricetes sp.]